VTGGPTRSGEAVITSLSFAKSKDADDMVAVSFTGTGALTVGTVPA
jgi:hypothetical protein